MLEPRRAVDNPLAHEPVYIMNGETVAQMRSMFRVPDAHPNALPTVSRTILAFQEPTFPAWPDMGSLRRHLEIHQILGMS